MYCHPKGLRCFANHSAFALTWSSLIVVPYPSQLFQPNGGVAIIVGVLFPARSPVRCVVVAARVFISPQISSTDSNIPKSRRRISMNHLPFPFAENSRFFMKRPSPLLLRPQRRQPPAPPLFAENDVPCF